MKPETDSGSAIRRFFGALLKPVRRVGSPVATPEPVAAQAPIRRPGPPHTAVRMAGPPDYTTDYTPDYREPIWIVDTSRPASDISPPALPADDSAQFYTPVMLARWKVRRSEAIDAVRETVASHNTTTARSGGGSCASGS